MKFISSSEEKSAFFHFKVLLCLIFMTKKIDFFNYMKFKNIMSYMYDNVA